MQKLKQTLNNRANSEQYSGKFLIKSGVNPFPMTYDFSFHRCQIVKTFVSGSAEPLPLLLPFWIARPLNDKAHQPFLRQSSSGLRYLPGFDITHLLPHYSRNQELRG